MRVVGEIVDWLLNKYILVAPLKTVPVLRGVAVTLINSTFEKEHP
jgi:hypothetical protein